MPNDFELYLDLSKITGSKTEKFQTTRSLKIDECTFFNILLEMIMLKVNINTDNKIFNKSNQVLTYADDIDVIGRLPSNVTNNFLAIEKAAKSVGLKVNGDKTKSMS